MFACGALRDGGVCLYVPQVSRLRGLFPLLGQIDKTIKAVRIWIFLRSSLAINFVQRDHFVHRIGEPFEKLQTLLAVKKIRPMN